MKQLGLGIIVAIGLTLPAFGQDVDPYIGTWKMNVEKSTCTCPLDKSETLTVTREGQNLINNVDGVDAQGRAFKRVYQHTYDGQPHTLAG
jgi:hypothetical protein